MCTSPTLLEPTLHHGFSIEGSYSLDVGATVSEVTYNPYMEFTQKTHTFLSLRASTHLQKVSVRDHY